MLERKSNRLKGYNYAGSGYYFVTVCTRDRMDWFGEIKNGTITLNEWGKISRSCWNDLPSHYANVLLDEFVIMPNHVHGIVIAGNRHACSLQPKKRQYQTLPIAIGGFKSAATRRIHGMKNARPFQWQKSYYDHVIRNERSLNQIRQYVLDNPTNWETDPENPVNWRKRF